MARTIVTHQYQLIVANLREGSDPSRGPIGNPVIQRSQFLQNNVLTIGGDQNTRGSGGAVVRTQTHKYVDPSDPQANATGEIEVLLDTFTTAAKIFLGDYVLISGRDFATGGGVAVTAGNIATAIDNLTGFAAVSAGPVVTVTGPKGIAGNQTKWGFENGASADLGNLVSGAATVPDTNITTLGDGTPDLGAPLIS